MITPLTKHPADRRALPVALAALNASDAEFVILFGSRARGHYHEETSDIDVMLIQKQAPGCEYKTTVAEAASSTAVKTYGFPITVDLVWRTPSEYRHNRRYTNSVETNAVRDGIIMPRDPEGYSADHYEDDKTEFAHDWSYYTERLRHAETHLDEFIFLADNNRSDLAIGQQAQNALEHGMKALILAADGQYGSTHNIGTLLGNVRHFDPVLADFRLAIPPDVYTEYEGVAEYRQRQQPLLTNYPDYAENTVADATRIIERAKALRALRDQTTEN